MLNSLTEVNKVFCRAPEDDTDGGVARWIIKKEKSRKLSAHGFFEGRVGPEGPRMFLIKEIKQKI